MTPGEQRYHQVAVHVVDWAGRVAGHEDTAADVIREMREWVGTSLDRVRSLAVASASCLKEMMQMAAIARTGNLLVVQQGSWFIKAMEGPSAREPDVIAAMQTAIAMANRDADMAHDILAAHERAGGPMALFGVATVATGALSCMLEQRVWDGHGHGGFR